MNDKEKFNVLDYWGEEQFRQLKKQTKIGFFKTKKFYRGMREHDWRSDGRNIKSLWYVSKAIYFGASKDIPFKTLAVLGRYSSDNRTADHTKTIIKDNVIKLENKYYKLDDLEKQTKIRKALKRSRSEDFEQFRQSA